MKEIENDFIKFWFEDGILLSKFTKSTVFDIEAVKQAIVLREQISDNESQYFLFDIRNVKSLPSDAREHTSKFGQNLVLACAVVVDSYITKFLYTTYKKFCPPPFPTAVFTTVDEAVEWLLELKAKNEAVSSS